MSNQSDQYLRMCNWFLSNLNQHIDHALFNTSAYRLSPWSSIESQELPPALQIHRSSRSFGLNHFPWWMATGFPMPVGTLSPGVVSRNPNEPNSPQQDSALEPQTPETSNTNSYSPISSMNSESISTSHTGSQTKRARAGPAAAGPQPKRLMAHSPNSKADEESTADQARDTTAWPRATLAQPRDGQMPVWPEQDEVWIQRRLPNGSKQMIVKKITRGGQPEGGARPSEGAAAILGRFVNEEGMKCKVVRKGPVSVWYTKE